MNSAAQVGSVALAWLAVCAILLVGRLAGESSTDAFERLRPGEWYEVPNSRLQSVLPSPLPQGDPPSIMEAWSGGTFDPVRNALVLAANGGHGDYAGNEVYAFFISPLSWERLTNPSHAPPPGDGTEALSDGRPASRHTYSGVAFLQNVDRVFLTGGSLWSGSGRGSHGAWYFDMPSREWQRRTDAPGNQVTAMAAYDPVTGLVFALLQSGMLAAYNPRSDSWTDRGGTGVWAEFDPARTMVLHPARRMLLVVGGGEVLSFDISRRRSSAQVLATSGGEPIVTAQGPGLAYDAVTDRIVGWAGGGDVYSLDLATRAWTRHPATSVAVPGAAPRQGTFGRWQYIPSRNAFIAANRINENVWIYKLSEGSGRTGAGARRPWLSRQLAPSLAAAEQASGPPTREEPAVAATSPRGLDIPNRTWVSRPLPVGSTGPGSPPYGSKHTRLLHDSKRGRMVLTGGDYANDYISDDGSHMVWAMDLASGPSPAWTLIGGWCNGPLQPGRPDTVVWVYDSKRDQGVIMPGFYFYTQRAFSGCKDVTDSPDSMLFDFSMNNWRPAPYGPPPDGYGGDLGSSFGVYDPVSDAVYRFRWGQGSLMEILSLATNKWSVVRLGAGLANDQIAETDHNRDQSVIDVQGRRVYVINRQLHALERYSISKHRIVDTIPLPREARPPEESDMETYLAFDPVNRVVLYPNTRENSGRVYGLGIYHVDTNRWEWEPTPRVGHAVQGNVVGFDAGNNAMMLYGGKRGDDIAAPSVFWLYRYGGGAPAGPSRQ